MRVGSMSAGISRSADVNAARAAGVVPVIAEGDGAFYAPKLDFSWDAIGRGGRRYDPARLSAARTSRREYVAEDGATSPVMLHRAILVARALHYIHQIARGVQCGSARAVVVATITRCEPSRRVVQTLRKAGLRVDLDVRNEKVGYKIREHSLMKVPVIAVVGKKEAEDRGVAIRRFGSQEQHVMSLADAQETLVAEATPPDLKRQ
jgi:threonyl-tRNA synthetase